MPPRTQTPDKPKTTLYHSELVDLTSNGPVQALIKSDVTPSKYKDKQPFVKMFINGRERTYNCENESCEAALADMRDQPVLIEASGSREEAELNVYPDDSGGEPPPARQQQRPAAGRPQERPAAKPATSGRPAAERPAGEAQRAPAPRQAAVQETPEQAVARAKKVIGRCASLLILCQNAAAYTFKEYHRLHEADIKAGLLPALGPDAITSATATFFIQVRNSNLSETLPFALPQPKPQPTQHDPTTAPDAENDGR